MNTKKKTAFNLPVYQVPSILLNSRTPVSSLPEKEKRKAQELIKWFDKKLTGKRLV